MQEQQLVYPVLLFQVMFLIKGTIIKKLVLWIMLLSCVNSTFITTVSLFLFLVWFFMTCSCLNLSNNDNAGSQGDSVSASCSQFETIIIMVTLPMTKAAFLTKENLYIASVATTAGVNRENVKVLSIDEISSRSLRSYTGRLLLAAYVQVQTSVLVPIGQQPYIKDQLVLNSNLNNNGLPSGTVVVQHLYPSVGSGTTPAPGPGDSVGEETGSAATSNAPIGTIVGGAVGFLILLVGSFLALRFRKNCLASRAPPPHFYPAC
jgi:hypothetical protein